MPSSDEKSKKYNFHPANAIQVAKPALQINLKKVNLKESNRQQRVYMNKKTA